jgi:tripartite-type tricarboxylate transporter receptor subunit TctC
MDGTRSVAMERNVARMRAVLGLLAGLLAAALAAGAARSQDFPTRPLQIVVPWPPGAIDIYVRLIKAPMEQDLGQPVIVETKPGANGYLGTQAVAEAKGDGYTLLANTTSSIVMGPLTSHNARFQVQRNFVPISGIYLSQFALVARKSLPVKSLPELIAYAKQNPGKLNYGSPGIGSSLHLISLNLCRVAGLEMTHVPYRGFAPLMQDLLGGTLDMAFVAVGTIRPMILAGNVTPLAVDQGAAPAGLGPLPHVSDLLPGFETVPNFIGLWAPTGTPKPVIDRLNRAVGTALSNDQVRKIMLEQGNIPFPGSPQAFAAEVDRNLAISTRLVEAAKAAGAKFE